MTFTPTGIYVPLVTPFTADDTIDVDDLTRLAHRVLDDGAAGLVALGTTAEASTLTPDERRLVVDLCAQACADHDAALIVGVGGNDTAGCATAIEALSGGPHVDAALSVVPYYSRPSEQGVVAHFEYLAQRSPLPLVLYNVPYRTGQPLSAAAILRLADDPRIVGIKQSVGVVDTDTAHLISHAPQGFSILAGEDTLVSPLLAMGARGAILATANVCTREFVTLYRHWRDGDVEAARELGGRLVDVAHALMSTPNPTAIKAVLHAQGQLSTPQVRLPLVANRDAAAAVEAVEASHLP